MEPAEMIASVQRYEKTGQKELFEHYYGRLAGIAERYSKNASQAQELILAGFTSAICALQSLKQAADLDLDQFMEREFILECVRYIKSFRAEYYVSSTVYATQPGLANYNLFEDGEAPDFNKVETTQLVKALQQLVPAQRLVFNLHVVDGFTMQDTASLLETSEPTVKSNLEKARYHLQKNIEKSVKINRS
jgi:RNA polymerase sigma factor (sigma-70 family)